MEKFKPLVIIPTYNEKENILEIIPEILALKKEFHILIVDDNSPDGTGEAADKLVEKYQGQVFVLHRKGKAGLGRAYLAGFKWALKKDYDLIFEMDADGSHLPKFLLDFLEKIKNYDLVIGSRYYKKRLSVVNWDLRRVVLSVLGNFYARIVTRVPVSDMTAGFKCFRRHVLETIDLDKIISEGYSFQIEMNWRVYKSGFKIGEIPIIFYERRHGDSKMSANIIKEALWILWRMLFRK
ncbi:polyprenol monophosphomannose synthase [Patescibacteria group bacterium]|nr:polyprenol monophosphomannose synthase [Patescibacteria group bacterium]